MDAVPLARFPRDLAEHLPAECEIETFLATRPGEPRKRSALQSVLLAGVAVGRISLQRAFVEHVGVTPAEYRKR
ncbi:hypothetical protein QZM22_25215 [Burkholderia oklahomensis]|nr:hypothetical protein [Burkholderia oklahomensis]